MSMESHFQLERLIHRAARYLDEQDYAGFLSLFSENAEYLITVRAPELEQKMTWMQQSRTELGERLEAMDKHEWEIAREEQSRLISIDIVEISGEISRTSTNFVIYRTHNEGQSECFAVGRYEDEWCLHGENWQLQRREVVLKTRQLPVLSPLPI